MKKHLKKWIILVVLLLVILGTYITVSANFFQKNSKTETTFNLKDSQILVYGSVSEIHGNEVTVQILEKQETEMIQDDLETESSEMPQRGERAQDRQMPEGMEMPEGIVIPEQDEVSSEDIVTTNSYNQTDETKTMLIPVGTIVTTKLGSETTFAKISTGDILGIVMEDDTQEVIVSITIIE